MRFIFLFIHKIKFIAFSLYYCCEMHSEHPVCQLAQIVSCLEKIRANLKSEILVSWLVASVKTSKNSVRQLYRHFMLNLKICAIYILLMAGRFYFSFTRSNFIDWKFLGLLLFWCEMTARLYQAKICLRAYIYTQIGFTLLSERIVWYPSSPQDRKYTAPAKYACFFLPTFLWQFLLLNVNIIYNIVFNIFILNFVLAVPIIIHKHVWVFVQAS